MKLTLKYLSSNQFRHCALLIAVVLLGIILRANAAIHQSFWQDEVYIFTTSRDNSPSDILLMNLHDKAHPQLYYLFIHYWQKINTSVLFLRLPSIIAGALTIILVFLIGKIVHGKTFGLMSALAFSVNPFFVNLGFQAKFYPFVFLFVFGSLYCAIRFLRSRNKYWLILCSACNALAFFTDYSAIWYFIAVGATMAVGLIARKTGFRSVASTFCKISMITLLLIGIGVIPLLTNLPQIIKDESAIGWDEFSWKKQLVSIDVIFRELMGFRGYGNYISTYVFIFPFILLTFLAFNKSTNFLKSFFHLLTLVSLLLPPTIMLAVSQFAPIASTRNLWISGLIILFGFALLWKEAVEKKSLILLLFGGLFLLASFITSAKRHYFIGITDWNKVISSTDAYQNDEKIFVFLDYENYNWDRLQPLRDYYLKGFNRGTHVKNYKIVTVPMQNQLDEELLSQYASQKAIWLFYSGEFLLPWSLNADEKEEHYANIKGVQRILHCENKPCRDAIFIDD